MEWIDIRGLIEWAPDRRSLAVVALVDQTADTVLQALLGELGFKLFFVDGSEIQDHESLFASFKKLFKFPDYFGKNWDAFNDSFGDFCQLQPGPIAIIWRDADITLRQAPKPFLEAVIHFQRTTKLRWEPEPYQVEVIYLGRAENGFTTIPVRRT